MITSNVPVVAMQQRLLDWYAANRRNLPWRETRDAYRIWVSEVMLQQTQVVTVIPYYLRFTARFPTVEALADATLDEVLAQWRGLGYYSRARSLYRAAQLVRDQYGGRIPASLPDLQALPGIGAYTSGAILSIAYNQDVVALDGNVIRVLCRVYNYAGDPAAREGRKVLMGYARTLLPHGQASTFNQAMMELGATICLPRSPRCPLCPLAIDCESRALGIQEERPITLPRKALPTRQYVSAYMTRDGKILLVRRVPRGLLGGLWELPGGELHADEPDRAGLERSLRDNFGLRCDIHDLCAQVSHTYTHFIARINVYCCDVTGTPQPRHSWDEARWVAPDDLATYGLTGVAVKTLAHIGITLPSR